MNRPWWVWPGPSSRKHRADKSILIYSLILLTIGLVLQYAIGPGITAGLSDDVSRNYYFYRHFIAIIIGLVGMYVAWKVPIKHWVRYSPHIFVFGIAMSLLTIAIDGLASRWIQIGFFSFQPVEVIKMAVIFGGAAYIVSAKRDPNFERDWKPVRYLLYALAISTFVVVVLQRDLGSMIIVAAIAMAMLFVSGFSLRIFGLFIIIAAIATSLFIFSTPYRRDRFTTFLNPQADCLDTGYHACQAIISVGSGGIFGRGVGKSVQVHGYIPEANNDSIFAVYAEVIGFAGSLALLFIMLKLYSTIYKVARQSELILKLIAVGILAWFSLQSIMNIGAMVGVLPLKGITLPYISYGGSSLMLVLFATGILLQISAYTVYGNEKTNDNSSGGRRVRRTRYATRGRRN